jgi:hypothetical protein
MKCGAEYDEESMNVIGIYDPRHFIDIAVSFLAWFKMALDINSTFTLLPLPDEIG